MRASTPIAGNDGLRRPNDGLGPEHGSCSMTPGGDVRKPRAPTARSGPFLVAAFGPLFNKSVVASGRAWPLKIDEYETVVA